MVRFLLSVDTEEVLTTEVGRGFCSVKDGGPNVPVVLLRNRSRKVLQTM